MKTRNEEALITSLKQLVFMLQLMIDILEKTPIDLLAASRQAIRIRLVVDIAQKRLGVWMNDITQ